MKESISGLEILKHRTEQLAKVGIICIILSVAAITLTIHYYPTTTYQITMIVAMLLFFQTGWIWGLIDGYKRLKAQETKQ